MQIPPIAIKRLGTLLALLFAAAALSASAAAQEEMGEFGELGEEAGRHALEPPDTSNPRATLRSFLDDARKAWTIFLTSDESRRERSRQAGRRLGRATLCLDLSEVPPGALDELVLCCLDKNPTNRPSSAFELEERLAAIRFDDPWDNHRAEAWWNANSPAQSDDAPTDLLSETFAIDSGDTE